MMLSNILNVNKSIHVGMWRHRHVVSDVSPILLKILFRL